MLNVWNTADSKYRCSLISTNKSTLMNWILCKASFTNRQNFWSDRLTWIVGWTIQAWVPSKIGGMRTSVTRRAKNQYRKLQARIHPNRKRPFFKAKILNQSSSAGVWMWNQQLQPNMRKKRFTAAVTMNSTRFWKHNCKRNFSRRCERGILKFARST